MPDESIPLTPVERKILTIQREFHEQPPTIFRLIQIGLRAYIIMGVLFLFLVCATATSSPAIWPLGSAAVGMLVGVWIRDIGWYRATIKSWPTRDRITDCKKVIAVLDGDGWNHGCWESRTEESRWEDL